MKTPLVFDYLKIFEAPAVKNVKTIRGFVLALKSTGIISLLKEALRRIIGINYWLCSILVNFGIILWTILSSLLRGYHVYSSGSEIIVRTPFGEFCASFEDADLLGVLFEPLHEMYGFVDVEGAIIIDVGAYIGETALLFLSRGASRVYAIEPVDRHYRYLLRNISRNNAVDRVIPLNYGAWFREATLSISYGGPKTGLHRGRDIQTTIDVRHLGDILREVYAREGRIDLVKMDCEGCEFSLLTVPNSDVRLAKQYIIEVHGSENLILDKMAECGYEQKLIKRIADLVTVYHFVR